MLYGDDKWKIYLNLTFYFSCQFVVKASEDYTVHLADPDTPVHWEQIEQVVLKTTSTVPSCPICLYPPKAGKM